MSYFFLFGKSKPCIKTYVDFKLEKNLSSELLNMDKTYDFVIKPLKKMTPWKPRLIYFFLEIEIFTTKIVNSKSLQVRKNLSSAFVDDERP